MGRLQRHHINTRTPLASAENVEYAKWLRRDPSRRRDANTTGHALIVRLHPLDSRYLSALAVCASANRARSRHSLLVRRTSGCLRDSEHARDTLFASAHAAPRQSRVHLATSTPRLSPFPSLGTRHQVSQLRQSIDVLSSSH